ncbi:hypothetical protein ACQ4PT_010141 [Festuca glaucescens]
MGTESESSDLDVQNQENDVPQDGDGHGKEIVQVDDEPMDGLERKKEEGSTAANKDKESGDAKTQRKEMAPRSDMWNHFNKVFVEGVLTKGKCKNCKREIKAHSVFNGTTALNKHFKVCKRNPHVHLKDQKQGVLQVTDFIGCWKFDPDKLRAAFAQMVIEDELPFAFGEKSGFRKFMAIACPRFKPPSRRTCTRDAVGTYYEEKAKVKLFFQEQCERVCITTDCWTSQQQDSYMTVTAHFIDKDWKLHKKIIGFFKIKGHRGEDIGKHLVTCLMEWGLDKVMTITVDNASSNDGGIGYVRKHMKTLIAGGKYLHMRCAAHIVNLIVSDGLKEVDLSVQRVRAAVRYVKNGTTRLEKFKECADLEKVDTKAFLNLDVCTRWNSTHDMLKAAIIYEKVFARYADEDPCFTIDLNREKNGKVQGPGVPEEQDWDNAKKMDEFLGHFAHITVRVSASLNVTANTFFHEIGEVNLLVRNWLESEDPLQKEMGKRMKDKYDKYWGKWHEKDLEKDMEKEKGKGKEKEKGKGKEKENINMMIFMAVVIDPRYKLSEYTEIAIGEMYGDGNGQKVWSAINKCLYELFEESRVMYAPVATDSAPQSTDAPRTEGGKGGAASLMKELIAKRMRLNTGASNSSKSELEKYLAEDCEDIESTNFDILAWWKTNSSRFPVLARLARDVLAIPISTVASESAFSTGGRVLDDFRTSLTPFMVEGIICTQDWLRRSTPINIQENTEELAKLEEELIQEFKNKATISSKSKSTKPSQPGTSKSGPNKSGPKSATRKSTANRKKK